MPELQMPGHQRFEYLLVIDIPGALRQKIEKAREELTTRFLIHQPKTGRPHVGLLRFTAMQLQEEKILNRLRGIAMAQQPFVIGLSDFGSYPMHCIYINISTQGKIKQLIRAFKEARQLLKANGDSPHFIEDPVLPLAARMNKDVYMTAVKEYACKHFSGQFVASSVLLLKRRQKNDRYHIVSRFEMEHLAVGTRQGELF